MFKSEQELKDFLIDWKYYCEKLKRLGERLDSSAFSVTMSYGEFKGGGTKKSAVETFALKKIELEIEFFSLLNNMDLCLKALNSCDLTAIEKGTIGCLVEKQSLAQFAEENCINCTYIYRIRDNAIKKMFLYIMTKIKKLAGTKGLEPLAYGFGDRYSTN